MSVEYDKVGTLRAQTHGHEPLVLAVHENQLSECRLSEMCPPLQTPSGKAGRGLPVIFETNNDQYMMTEARVRKLTPIECERLQGFPDNYTRIPWKGKSAEECPDSPRYKAIGNSWAVPCVRWIGKRIQDELEKNK